MSAIEFVHDYVQMRFDDLCLTLNNRSSILVRGAEVASDSDAFLARLADRVGRRVVQASYRPTQPIRITFDDGVELRMAVGSDEQATPEAAVLSGETLGKTFVW